MGSPRQTFAGETRLSRLCRWPRAAEGRSASHFKIYPSLLEQPRPCLPPQERWRRRRRRTQRSHRDSLLSPRNISGPTQPNPNAFTSVVDLSSAVFRYEPFKKTEPFQEGDGDLKPSFPFWRAEYASSQLVFKLSLVKTISPVPPCPTLSRELEREGTFKEVWEASRLTPGRLFIFLHKTHWVFLTHNSCAMMHKRQLWSKFKIQSCKICRCQDQSAIGIYVYLTLHILSSIPGGSTNQC